MFLSFYLIHLRGQFRKLGQKVSVVPKKTEGRGQFLTGGWCRPVFHLLNKLICHVNSIFIYLKPQIIDGCLEQYGFLGFEFNT